MADAAPARSVLLVTDDVVLRDAAAFAFPPDMDIMLAADAREAWEQMRSSTPDLVVADIGTGSSGGYGLARDMDSRARLAKIPILMLLERSQDAWLARQAGADRWLARPFEPDEIVQKALELVGAPAK